MLPRHILWVLLAASAIGCGGTPQTDPLMAKPVLDGELVQSVPTYARSTTTVKLRGQPGSAAPPGGVVRVVDLDGTGAPVETIVDADGSFEVTLQAQSGGVLRLDVRSGAQRSAPVDVRVEADIVSPALPTLTCWTTSGPVVEVTDDGGTVRIINDCSEPIHVSRAALRVDDASFTLGAAPAEVPSGSGAEVAVGYVPSGTGSDEEILLLDIDAPVQDRRAVTLVGLIEE